MRCNYESIARWNRHFAEMCEQNDKALAAYIVVHAPAERTPDGFYDWMRTTPSARVLWDQIYYHHGTAWRARAAWDKREAAL